MIEVVISPTGDSAEVETPEEAVAAARTLIDDAFRAQPTRTQLRAAFYVEGKLVRKNVKPAELGNLHCKGFPESIASGSRVNKFVPSTNTSVETNGGSTTIKEEVVARTKEKTLQDRLMDGFTVKSRPDGSVHNVKGKDDKTTVAEVCVGKKQVRLNFRKTPGSKAPKGLDLSGKSQSWKGGGVVINEGNLSAARAMLKHVVGTVEPTASGAQAASASSNANRSSARSRVSGGRKTQSSRSSRKTASTTSGNEGNGGNDAEQNENANRTEEPAPAAA